MSKLLQKDTVSQSDRSNQNDLQFLLISGSLIGTNIFLMLFVGMYWLNPSFHTLMTGKPLQLGYEKWPFMLIVDTILFKI